MRQDHPLIQIVIRAAWISFWMILAAFLLTKPIGYGFTVDPVKLIAFSLVLISIIQIFKKSNSQQTNTGRTAYQVKYGKLVNMVGGDRQTADRLISAYGIDRAISDLERDRRIN